MSVKGERVSLPLEMRVLQMANSLFHLMIFPADEENRLFSSLESILMGASIKTNSDAIVKNRLINMTEETTERFSFWLKN